MWKIGTVQIDEPIVAAPLAGISNPVYREMCRRFGAGLVVSEMISDKALHYKSRKTKQILWKTSSGIRRMTARAAAVS